MGENNKSYIVLYGFKAALEHINFGVTVQFGPPTLKDGALQKETPLDLLTETSATELLLPSMATEIF
nr:ORF2 [Torque teno felis virus]QYD01799.1 ORF2 [Torque teno felis virus]QYD01847.1 ORF2 [Torque teno felis virus]QYD01850.1 ORF2 [Torque teno felis virus]